MSGAPRNKAHRALFAAAGPDAVRFRRVPSRAGRVESGRYLAIPAQNECQKESHAVTVEAVPGMALVAGVAAPRKHKRRSPSGGRSQVPQECIIRHGQHFGRLGPVVKGERAYDKDEVAKNAAIAEQMSKLPWEGFVAGSDKGDTGAKPEIWTDAAKFKSPAKRCSRNEQARPGQQEWRLECDQAQFGETGKACKACHDDFRKKP